MVQLIITQKNTIHFSSGISNSWDENSIISIIVPTYQVEDFSSCEFLKCGTTQLKTTRLLQALFNFTIC